MKNNFSLLILFFLISCSSKIDTSLNVNDLKKEGSQYILSSQKKETFFTKNKINKVNFYKLEKEYNATSSKITSSNFLKNTELNNSFNKIIEKKIFNISKNNKFKKNIVSSKDKLFFIDDFSNFTILDMKFNLIKKLKIHNKLPSSLNYRYSIVYHNDLIFVADNLGSIFAYDVNKNVVLWRNDLGVPFLSNISLYKNSIFVTNANGKLFSFKSISGLQNWSFETGTSVLKSLNAYHIAIEEDKLIFSNDIGTIYCIDLKVNTILWTLRVPSFLNNFENKLFYISNFILENNFLYLTTSFENILKINLQNGAIVWQIPVHTLNNAIINVNTVSLIDSEGFFLVLDKDSGDILFKHNLKQYLNNRNNTILFNSIFIGSNKFYILSDNGIVIQIDSQDLEKIILKKISKKSISNIVINNNKIFFIDSRGAVNKIE